MEFARLGYTVKEMLGGFEYWAREGWALETGTGAITRRSVDPLTAPVSGIDAPAERPQPSTHGIAHTFVFLRRAGKKRVTRGKRA